MGLYKNKISLMGNKRKKILLLIIYLCSVVVIVTITCFVYNLMSNKEIVDSQIVVSRITNPENYTWEEYQALTPEEKMMFPDNFKSMDAFNAWYENVQPAQENINVPTIDLKGKNPEDFTWEEYQALTPEEKMVFPDYFESMDAFNAWYDRVCPTS